MFCQMNAKRVKLKATQKSTEIRWGSQTTRKMGWGNYLYRRVSVPVVRSARPGECDPSAASPLAARFLVMFIPGSAGDGRVRLTLDGHLPGTPDQRALEFVGGYWKYWYRRYWSLRLSSCARLVHLLLLGCSCRCLCSH